MWSDPRRVALVTGAGSGIGRQVALTLAAKDYRVLLVGRTLARLEETAALAPVGSCLPIAADICDADAVAAAFALVETRFGRLDLLFNNAGINAGPTLIDDMDLSTWRQVVDTTLTGAFLCTKHAFGLMKSQTPRGGRIINNGSVSAHSPRPKSSAYTAAKHGLTGLTKSTSLDGRAFDIACGQIDIGNAATDMAATQRTGAEQADGSIAVEPVIDAALVASTVVYMAELPLDANVQFITLVATKMPLVGRG